MTKNLNLLSAVIGIMLFGFLQSASGQNVIYEQSRIGGSSQSNNPDWAFSSGWPSAASSAHSSAPGLVKGVSTSCRDLDLPPAGIPWFTVSPNNTIAGQLVNGTTYSVAVSFNNVTSSGEKESTDIVVTASDTQISGIDTFAGPTTAFQSGNGLNTWITVGVVTVMGPNPTFTFTWLSGSNVDRWNADSIQFTPLPTNSLTVTIDNYRNVFSGVGSQSYLYDNEQYGLNTTEQRTAWDWIFCDVNMGYYEINPSGVDPNQVTYALQGLQRNPNLKFAMHVGIPAECQDTNGNLNISDPEVYNEMATNWFTAIQAYAAAGVTTSIVNVMNEPDYEGPLLYGYASGPQGIAMIMDQAVGRLITLFADPTVNTSGLPRPLFAAPNTLNTDTTMSYIGEMQSNYPNAWQNLDIVTTHQYASGVNTNSLGEIGAAAMNAGKQAMDTEMYPNFNYPSVTDDGVGSPPIDDESRAVLSLSALFSAALNAGFNSWWYWQAIYPTGDNLPAGIEDIVWQGPPRANKHYWAWKQLTSVEPANSYVLGYAASGLEHSSILAMRQPGDSNVIVHIANDNGYAETTPITLQSAAGAVSPYAYYLYLTGTNAEMVVTGPFMVPPGATSFVVTAVPYALTTIQVLLAPPAPVNAALGHWSLNDASGTTAKDSSSNGDDATLGAGDVWTNGVVEGAIAYPAYSSPVVVNHNFGTVSQFSCACWFNLAGPGRSQNIISSTGSNPWSAYFGTSAYTNVSTLCFSIGTNFWDTVITADSNQWHHLAVTVDASNSTNSRFRVYLDGALHASSLQPPLAPITLGNLAWGGNLNGSMDDVWLFNSILSSSQVQSLNFLSVPSALKLSWSTSNGNLTLSWPLAYQGWILQSRADQPGPWNNWVDIPGTSLINATNFSGSQSNSAVFYRLRAP